MQQPTATTFGSTKFCWICGRPVSLEKCKIDEHGSVVHDECYTARVKLKNAGNENGANFWVWKQQFRDDCELHEKLDAFAALGDSVLKLLWEGGVSPTVKAVVEGVREGKPN